MSKDREELIELGAKASVASFAETFAGGGWADPPRWEDHSERGQWRFKQAFAAALSAIEAAGFVVVPREPTVEMKDAAYEADLDIYWCYASDGRPGGPNDAYRAMINAYSPKTSGGDTPPTTEEEGA